MHPYHELAKIHQNELLADAEHARLAKDARRGSRAARIPARRPLAWLREVAGSVATRITTFSRAQAGNH
jgi:hypothetical protein